jgi:site-specific DNA-methyltransferase (adenine-specific)
MKKIADGSVDLIVTDPPYSFPTNQFRPEARISQRTFGDFSTYQHFFTSFLNEATRTLKKEGDIYVFCDEVFYAVLFPLFYSRFYSTKMVVWNKKRIGMGGGWRRQYEIIIHARMLPAKTKSGDGDIIECSPVRDKLHQSQKPVELIEKLLSKNPLMGGTVLDPFMGSGTTGVACKNLNRNFIGIELDETYYNIAKQRIEGAIDIVKDKTNGM